jgi:beta-N-acetylhexosaminidase
LKYPSLAKQLVYLKSFITNYYLFSLGIDVNTIPVLDIPNSKTVSMIKKRTFGSNLKINTILTDILIQSSFEFGVMPVMKHFPGHGLTNKDSHFTKPVTNASTKALNHQLSLFKTFVKLPMIMTAHIQYQNWDNHNIATFSPYILKDILRKKLKYKGLVMSDDLVMKANNQSIEKSIDQSNKSGLDIILDCSSDWKRYIKILENFKKTNFFNNKNKILFSKKTSNRRLQSININHYHDLYNELIKLYGI